MSADTWSYNKYDAAQNDPGYLSWSQAVSSQKKKPKTFWRA